MRVSDRMMFAGVARRLQSGYVSLEGSMRRISSGKAVERASDDPVRFHRGRSAEQALDRARAFEDVANRAQSDLATADSALATLQNSLGRGLEIAVSSASEHWNASMRTNIAVEVDGLYDAILSVVNSRSNGRYLFGGTADGSPPFAADGSYVGAADPVDVEVLSGVHAKVRYDGSQTFATGAGNVLTLVDDFRNALRANDSVGLRSAIDGIRAAVDDVARAQAEIGSEGVKVDQSLATASLQIVDLSALKDRAVAADLGEEASQLALAQRRLDAVRLSASRVLDMGLLNLR